MINTHTHLPLLNRLIYVHVHSLISHTHTFIATSPLRLHHLSAQSCRRSCGENRKTPRRLHLSCPGSVWSWSCVSSCCSWSPRAPAGSSDTSLMRSWAESGSQVESRRKGAGAVHLRQAEKQIEYFKVVSCHASLIQLRLKNVLHITLCVTIIEVQ